MTLSVQIIDLRGEQIERSVSVVIDYTGGEKLLGFIGGEVKR